MTKEGEMDKASLGALSERVAELQALVSQLEEQAVIEAANRLYYEKVAQANLERAVKAEAELADAQAAIKDLTWRHAVLKALVEQGEARVAVLRRAATELLKPACEASRSLAQLEMDMQRVLQAPDGGAKELLSELATLRQAWQLVSRVAKVWLEQEGISGADMDRMVELFLKLKEPS